MKHVTSGLLGSALVATSLVALVDAPASATTATPYLKSLAKQMRCKYGEAQALSTDAQVAHGWNCVVGPGTSERREYYLMTYRNTSRGVDEWRDWFSCTTYEYDTEPCEPGYMARKGGVLIIDQSNDSYTYEAAAYAARKTGGRVVPGYRYQG